MNKYIALIALLLLPSLCNAAKGEFLLEGCIIDVNYDGGTMPDTIDAMKQGYCIGLIAGIIDTARLYHNNAICIKDDCSYGEAKNIVISYLKNHPNQLQEEDFPLVISALKEAFPCK